MALTVFDAAISAIDAVGAKVLPEKINTITKKHALIGAAAGAIPVPGAAMVAVAANIWHMYKEINDALGISFSKNKLKTIISGVVANLGSTAALALGAGELLKFIPGLGTVTGAVMEAAIDAAITYTAAFIYLKAITALANKDDVENITEEDLKQEIDDYMKNNKGEIDKVFNEAKTTYKNEKNIANNKESLQSLEEEMKEEENDDNNMNSSNGNNDNNSGEANICTSCGAKIPQGSKFCCECGNKIEVRVFCPECGAELANGMKFCSQCGTKVV